MPAVACDGSSALMRPACRCVWNAALPLLQHNLRPHVKRPFMAAANALAATAAPCHELRAKLHYEVAKCDEADDLLMSAKAQAMAAASLDYVGADAQVEQFRLARPLDRLLEPLQEGLQLRTSFQQAPGSPLAGARLQIARAREAKCTATCASALAQAMAQLRSCELVQPPATAQDADRHKEQYFAARHLTELWAAVAKVAYKGQAYSTVLQAAPVVAWFHWQTQVDKEVVVLQATCSLLECQAALHALRVAGQSVVSSADPPVSQGTGSTEVRAAASSPSELRAVVQSTILSAMDAGLACKEHWLVVNGAVAAWNAYLPDIQAQRYVSRAPLRTESC